jgi:hypothetical protein
MAGRIKAENEKFCQECGEIILAKAEICPRCGVRQASMANLNTIAVNALGHGQPRSRVVAGVFAVLTGSLGLHKFYLGQPVWGIVYLLLCWTFIPTLLGLAEGLYFLTTTDEKFASRHAGPAWSSR